MEFNKVLENTIFATSYAGKNSTQPATKHKRKNALSLKQLEKELKTKQEELAKAKKEKNGERTIRGIEANIKNLKIKIKNNF